MEFKRKIPNLYLTGIGNTSTGNMFFSKIRWSNLKETRGLIKKIYPIMVTQEVLFPHRQNPYLKLFWGFTANGGANFLNTNIGYDKTAEDLLYTATETALVAQGSWNIYLKDLSDVIGIKILIHPSSLKDLFKLRDLPYGKERRASLLHWVSQYYRHKPNKTTEEDLIEVSQCLRGAYEFNWNGLQCKITPSNDDLEALRRIKESKIAI